MQLLGQTQDVGLPAKQSPAQGIQRLVQPVNANLLDVALGVLLLQHRSVKRPRAPRGKSEI